MTVPQIPGYTDLAEIGRGGQARIYRGFNVRLGRFEAIKVYRSDGDETTGTARDRVRRRFDTEARLAGPVTDPHVIRVHQSADHDGVPCLFMEYLDGRSLRTVLDETDTAPTPQQVVAIARDVAAGLGALARADRPVVHRDVKPDNILLERDQDGGYRRAVLADFGIAVAASDRAAAADSAGTARYMAPEQLRRRRLGPQTDQYGLAATVYEMLAGRPPAGASTVVDRLIALSEPGGEAYVPLPGADRRTRRVDAVLRRALQDEPDRRFADASEFAEELAAAFGLPNARPRPGLIERARRSPAQASAAVLALLLVLTVAGVGAVYGLTDRRATVYPMLATAGMFSPCADLTDDGFTPDPRHPMGTGDMVVHQDAALASLRRMDGVIGTGEPGSFETVEDAAMGGFPDDGYVGLLTQGWFYFPFNPATAFVVREQFRFDSIAELEQSLAGAGTVFPRLSDCRYLSDPDNPVAGAVLNVYTGGAMPTFGARAATDTVVDRFGADSEQTVTVELDGGHKTDYRRWQTRSGEQEMCAAQLTGADAADIDPLLILHRHERQPGPDACARLDGLLDSVLGQAWRSAPDLAGPGGGDRHTAADREEVFTRIQEGSRPCADHRAVGLERAGAAAHPLLGEGCWYRTGGDRRVALFQAPPQDFDTLAVAPPVRLDGDETDGEFAAVPTDPEVGRPAEGMTAWKHSADMEVPGEGVLPFVWVERTGEPEEYNAWRAGIYLQQALIHRAIGSAPTF